MHFPENAVLGSGMSASKAMGGLGFDVPFTMLAGM